MHTPTIHHVETDAKVEAVEKYFKQLDFSHRLRLATETFVDKCIEEGSDAKIKAKGCFGTGHTANFTITVSLDE
jgi:hypothetical protein